MVVGDIVRGEEVIAANVSATLDGPYYEPRMTLVFPDGAAVLGETYRLRSPEWTIKFLIDRPPTRIDGVDGDVVDACIIVGRDAPLGAEKPATIRGRLDRGDDTLGEEVEATIDGRRITFSFIAGEA